jgi:hypothetical protein
MDFARFPATFWPFPFEVTQILTWVIVSWELFFPVLVCVPRLRTATLILGVVFHVGLAITMEINMFAPYMLCLYLPLVPWERWADGSTGGPP